MKVIAIASLAGAMLATTVIAQPASSWQKQLFATKYGRTFATNNAAQNPSAAVPATQLVFGLNASTQDQNRSTTSALQ